VTQVVEQFLHIFEAEGVMEYDTGDRRGASFSPPYLVGTNLFDPLLRGCLGPYLIVCVLPATMLDIPTVIR